MLTFADGETIETTGEHPFYVQGEGFIPAGRLALGNAIVTRAGPATRLVRAVWNAAPKTVYNFTVEGDHTYFVGKNSGGLWVHNIPCVPKGGTYKLIDEETNEVVRTGRAKNLRTRQLDHARDPELKDYKFEVDKRTDSYAAQRGREQIIHDQYNPPLNKIRPIAPSNPRRPTYMREGKKL